MQLFLCGLFALATAADTSSSTYTLSPTPTPVPTFRALTSSSAGDIYHEIRSQSEQNCLIPYQNYHNETEKDNEGDNDPRTILNPLKKCHVYYLHNHKSGGTTICSTFRHEGYVSIPNTNCLPPPPYHHFEYQFIKTPKEQLVSQYAMEHNYNFIAQEGPYFNPNLTNTESILYMTTIRNPYDRIISHLHHELCIRRNKETAIAFINSFQCDFDIRRATLADIILSNCFNKTLQHITSNFYLRMFTNCFGSECTQEHLAEAIAKLNIMSVVMITDTQEEFMKYEPLYLGLSSPHSSVVDMPSFSI